MSMFNERGQVCMNEQHGGLQSRLVADRKRDGRRKYDEDAKREFAYFGERDQRFRLNVISGSD
ncbi:hypothetical protein [Burkholderia glumae]